MRFHIPPWHTPLLASRLISMLRADMEFGVVPQAVAAVLYHNDVDINRCNITSTTVCLHRQVTSLVGDVVVPHCCRRSLEGLANEVRKHGDIRDDDVVSHCLLYVVARELQLHDVVCVCVCCTLKRA